MLRNENFNIQVRNVRNSSYYFRSKPTGGCMESMRQRKGPLSKPWNGRVPKAEHALYPGSKNERQREERQERRLVLKGLGF